MSQLYETLSNANELIYEETHPNGNVASNVVTLTKARYGGWRTDRLGERNAITNKLGFPEVKGREFWSLDTDKGWGTFLADAIVDCLRGRAKLIADGQEVVIPSDWSFSGAYIRHNGHKVSTP